MVKKLFLMLLIIIICIFAFSVNKVNAISIGNIIGGADNFVNDGKQGSGDAINSTIIQDTSSLIYNTLLIIGISAAVIVGTVLGIQFITGSVEQKVKVQESLLPYLAGCVVLFSAFGIWKLVITFLR